MRARAVASRKRILNGVDWVVWWRNEVSQVIGWKFWMRLLMKYKSRMFGR